MSYFDSNPVTEVVNKLSNEIAREKQDWIMNCLRRAHVPVDEFYTMLQSAIEGKSLTDDSDEVSSFVSDEVKKFYERHQVNVIPVSVSSPFIDKEIHGMELLEIGGEIYGAWKNDYGISFDSENLKATIRQWVK